MQSLAQWLKERVPSWPGIGAVMGLVVSALVGYSNRPTFFGLKIPIEEIFKNRQLANDMIVTFLIWAVPLTAIGAVLGLVIDRLAALPPPPTPK